MRMWKNPKIWIRAAVVGVALGPTTAFAEFPPKLETAGRLFGAGWGDGYHACARSGIRIGADLPPKSYSVKYGAASHRARTGIGHRIGATFYDRFDAGNSCRCKSQDCDASGCDGVPITIHGSQVIQGDPQVHGRAVIPPAKYVQPPHAQTPRVAPTPVAPNPTPAVEKSIELTHPLSQVRRSNAHPVRPTAPAKTHVERVVVASESKPSVGNWGQAQNTTNNPAPVSSATPGPIRPVHPYDAGDRPAKRRWKTADTVASATPNMQIPSPAQAVRLLEQQAVRLQEQPLPASPSRVPAFVPSYAMSPTATAPSAPSVRPATPSVNPAPTLAGPGPYRIPAARPTLLGSNGLEMPKGNSGHASIATVTQPERAPKRMAPTRLGGKRLGLRANPFASRPALELAERPDEPGPGTIEQPSTLK